MQAFIDFPNDDATTDPLADPLVVRGRWQGFFSHPLAVLTARQLPEVAGVLQQVQTFSRAGHWCVGGLTYEAAGAFDAALVTHPGSPDWPLARFAVYDRVQPWPQPILTSTPQQIATQTSSHAAPAWDGQLNRTYPDYAERVNRVIAAMAGGECYQINLTEMLQSLSVAMDTAEIAAWFARLRRAQPGGYQAWLDWGDQQVLSLSPELFFDWRDGQLTCQPMKGTASRHAEPLTDSQACQQLKDSPKERAENVMIVDLLRNDMGRIARPGTVRVSKLFEVQALPTVWQMTSTITATTLPEVGLPELFAALFPCGSVTGAPKARAMHWIEQLEQAARGLYCGAVGVVRPGGAATFNVPIRTVTLRKVTPTRPPSDEGDGDGGDMWQASAGVGSAITVYADAPSEWQELAAKTRYLERARADFSLLETLRLEDGEYWLLPEHLSRMAASAAYFGCVWQPDAVRACLDAVVRGREDGTYRVRLTCSPQGDLSAEAFVLLPTAQPVRFNRSSLFLATQGRDHEFVVHKTTRRDHYDTRLLPAPGVFDTLLCNERGEVTEFTRGNLALRLNGQWLTPALACGLLPGTYRAHQLAKGELTEAVLTWPDVQRAEQVVFFNSLRGWLLAEIHAEPLTSP